MDKLLVGVIGVGRIGKLHIDNLLQHFPKIAIKLIADPHPDLTWVAERHLTLAENVETLILDKDIKAVLICSPSPKHCEQIIACAQVGKHVFCEKPISTDINEIVKVLKVIEATKIKFQVGFNRRFDPNFLRIKQIVYNNDIGNPYLVRITSRDPKIPPINFLKSSGGMFIDMSIHDFDMAQFLMNSPVEEVYASGMVLIDPLFNDYEDIDTAIINLKFANGSLGVIDNSRQAVYGYDQRVEVFGSKGAVHADNNKPTNTVISTIDGVAHEKPLYYFLERYKESYIAELQDFFEKIETDQPCSVSGSDGLSAMQVALAAKQSVIENRPISIKKGVISGEMETRSKEIY